jgi:hypothetical protein
LLHGQFLSCFTSILIDTKALSTHMKRREYYKEIGNGNIHCLQDVPARFAKDKSFTIKAVQCNGLALQYAGLKFQNDFQVVLEAVKNDGNALQYASMTLRNDKRIVLEAVSRQGKSLVYASGSLNSDKNFVLEAIKQNPRALQYVSVALQSDKQVVLAAVQQNSSTLEYASETLCDDEEVVLTALKQNGTAILHCSNRLKGMKRVALEAVKQCGATLNMLYSIHQRDDDIVLTALETRWNALTFVPYDLCSNKEFILKALRHVNQGYPTIIPEAAVIRIILKRKSDILAQVCGDLLGDKDIILEALTYRDIFPYKNNKHETSRQEYLVKQWQSHIAKHENTTDIITILHFIGKGIKYAHYSLETDKQFLLEVIKRNPYIIMSLYTHMVSDMDILALAFQHIKEYKGYIMNSLSLQNYFVKENRAALIQLQLQGLGKSRLVPSYAPVCHNVTIQFTH